MPGQNAPCGHLIVINGLDHGFSYTISPGRTEIGRSPEAAISLSDENVSRQHAVLEATEYRVVLIDCGSVNGTWVNNRRLNGPCPLREGDVVEVGAVSLRFRSVARRPALGDASAEGGDGVAFGEVREPLGTDVGSARAGDRPSRRSPEHGRLRRPWWQLAV